MWNSIIIAAIFALCGTDAPKLRIATFNIWELSAAKVDMVDGDGHGTNPQLHGAAEIIQRVHPDILFINEIDYSSDRDVATQFRDRYLAVAQSGQPALNFPYVYSAPVNTGVPTGKDLDNDKKTDGPGDAYGYGRYPGQYGMALLSRYPIDASAVRTFQKLLWRDMPDNLMPDGTAGKPDWYDADETAIFRLSSKSHWDVPIRINGATLHVLCSHPTPPVFDGDEDRNGRRNYDEIRLLADYLGPPDRAAYIIDDKGKTGPLDADASFVILGDLNSDPSRDPADYGKPAMAQLLSSPRVLDPAPESKGALGKNNPGPPYHIERKTCDFGCIDYVLCSRDLKVIDSGVFWPTADDSTHKLTDDRAASSDHHLVWVDVEMPGSADGSVQRAE
ncbi:MAG: endonuclease/exonuclease/phosphatase family protein [Phycisphaerales bacterium]|nr:endonuclease/exonuclease/phosphatase family protein [Phycisphaerales bacterium]